MISGLFTHGAIIAALYSRQKTGKGQKIDVSLLEAQVASLVNTASSYLVGGVVQRPLGTAHQSIVPYQAFRTMDGHMIVGALNDAQFHRLCQVLGVPQLASEQRFRCNPDRVRNRRVLIPLLQQEFLQRTTAEWERMLSDAKVPCGPINNMEQVFKDPQVGTHAHTL